MTVKLPVKLYFHQWITGLGISLLALQAGFLIGWSSPALARLTAPDSPIPLDAQQASWVASLLNFGRLFGVVIGAGITTYLGSKRCTLSALFPGAVGWIMIALANSAEWLYIARLLSGLAEGIAFSSFAVYIGEVSIPKIRGALIASSGFGGCVGAILSSACTAHWSLATSSIFYFVWCIICMAIFCYLPESPHHLVKVGQHKAAEKSIQWYRAGVGVKIELEAIEKFVATDKTVTFISTLQEFKSPVVLRATAHIIVLFTFLECCGSNTIMFYMETILSKTNFTFIDPSDIVIYVNISTVCASLISIFLIDSYGRRFSLLTSSIGVMIGMIGLTAYFLLIDFDIDTANIEWIPAASMFIFSNAYSLGFIQVPNSVLSEIFPTNIKYIAACMVGLTAGGLGFLSTSTYQPMLDLMGEKYVFLVHALLSGIAIPYALFVMPETKGKTLQQIQDELSNP